MTARIIIADDHEILRDGVRALLARVRPEWEICGEAADGAQAIALVDELQPDLVILDITMPGISGLEACLRIRQAGSTCPILIFTTHQSGRLADDAMRCGANGCVTKSQAARQLVLAIDTLLSGGTYFGSPGAPESPPRSPALGTLLLRSLVMAA
jgi:DNA-binding NarL/FixJ family response regulator